MKNKVNWGLLLAGMFSNTQINIGGNIGISELFFCVIAPFVFIADLDRLRRDGFMPLTLLALASVFGCCLGAYCNDTYWRNFLKGFGTVYSVWASIIVFHRLFRHDLDGARWLFLGFAITQSINIFIFHQGAEGAVAERMAASDSTVDMVTALSSGTLFWVNRLTYWLMLPIRGWYLTTSSIYSASVPLGLAVFAIAFTGSGRSSALGALGGAFLVIVVRKSLTRMKLISKNFFSFVVISLIALYLMKTTYVFLGQNEMLSSEQMTKFKGQTRGGEDTSILQILMSGRIEFFSGLYAAIKKPIVGYGPWPMDEDRIYFNFLEKYGGIEDWNAYYRHFSDIRKRGQIMHLVSHSIIIEFWQWYGIFGLLFWLYILWQLYIYIKKYVSAVPQWFGILAVGMPVMLWNIFFSPFGFRMVFASYFVLLLFNRAIGEGRIRLPNKMILEIQKYAR